MKGSVLIYFTVVLMLLSSAFATEIKPDTGTLTIVVDQLRVPTGTIYYNVFNTEKGLPT